MNMPDKKILSELRTDLLGRRRELIDSRTEIADSYQELNQPEREMEETAAKANLSRGLDQLDARDKELIQKIDDALLKMDEGRYGLCEACGEPISIKRLDAVPEARHCIRCARQRQSFESGEAEASPLALEEQELTDAEMQASIEDALQNDGRVDTEELEIRCEAGVVNLDGLLPSERQRRILHETIEDVLGFDETVDNTTIDRQPWERQERNRPPEREKTDKDIQMEGEDEEVDVHTSLETGEPMTPPDRILPEKE